MLRKCQWVMTFSYALRKMCDPIGKLTLVLSIFIMKGIRALTLVHWIPTLDLLVIPKYYQV